MLHTMNPNIDFVCTKHTKYTKQMLCFKLTIEIADIFIFFDIGYSDLHKYKFEEILWILSISY